MAWVAAIIVPVGASAYWPIAAASRVLARHAVRFTSDAISPLPIAHGDWVVQPWLSTIAIKGAWEAAGVAGLGLLGAVLAATTTVGALRVARRAASPLAAAVSVAATLTLLFPPTLRTEAVAVLLGMSVVVVVGSRLAAWTPLLIIVWANCHGSVPVGVGMCACAAVGVLDVGGRLGLPQGAVATWRVERRAAWLAACAIGMLCSPLGWGLFDYIGRINDVPSLTAITPIWRPLELGSWRAYVIAAAIVLVAVGAWRPVRLALGEGRTWRRAWYALAPLGPPLAFVLLTVRAERQVAWLAVLLVAPVARGVAAVWPSRAGAGELTSPLVAGALAVVSLLFVAGLSPGGTLQHRFARNGGPPLDDLSQVHHGDRVWASIEWADEVRVRTGARVFVDARLERYRGRDIRAYLRATGHGKLRGTGLGGGTGCDGKWNVLLLRVEKTRPLVRRVAPGFLHERAAFVLCAPPAPGDSSSARGAAKSPGRATAAAG
jgi:hypothetical protein